MIKLSDTQSIIYIIYDIRTNTYMYMLIPYIVYINYTFKTINKKHIAIIL